MKLQKTIIWDLSGTLIDTIKPKGLSSEQTQLLSLLLHTWGGKKKASSYDIKALNVLYSFGRQHGPDKEIVKFYNDKPLPIILCKWLSGLVSSQQIIDKAFIVIEHDQTIDNREKKLLKDMIRTNFDSAAIASIMVPYKHAIDLLTLGQTLGYRQYFFSNWDAESFEYTYRSIQLEPLFHMVERSNIVISADTGYAKPQRGAFNFIINKYKLEPAQCLFIDNQQENIVIAQEYGMNTYLFDKDYQTTQDFLREHA